MTGPVTFADLSHHQDVVDLATYAAHHPVVVLKATEGTGFLDPTFTDRWELAGRLGLIRGAYHYAHTTASAVAQADAFADALTAAGPSRAGDLVILDVEDDTTLDAIRTADEFASLFCERMLTRGYPTGTLYTGRWYADPAGITPGDVPTGWRHLWLSDYSNATDTAMALPSGWDYAHVVARQFTNSATVPGITGPVDLSRTLTTTSPFGGTMAAMTGPEFSRAFLGALADTGDVGQFGNDLWLQLRRIASEGAKEQTGPLAAQLSTLTTIVGTIATAVGMPDGGDTLAALLEAVSTRVDTPPLLSDADVDRIAAAVIARVGAGVTLTVTPATTPAPTGGGQATT